MKRRRPKGRRSAPSRCAGAAARGGAVSPARGTARGALGPGSGAPYPCFSLSSGGVVEGPCSGGVRVRSETSHHFRRARRVGAHPGVTVGCPRSSRARLLPLSPLSSFPFPTKKMLKKMNDDDYGLASWATSRDSTSARARERAEVVRVRSPGASSARGLVDVRAAPPPTPTFLCACGRSTRARACCALVRTVPGADGTRGTRAGRRGTPKIPGRVSGTVCL